MTPERWAEIKKISTGLGSHGLLVGIIHELIAEVERLTVYNTRLRARCERLTAELEAHRTDNARIQAELEAELAEMRRGLEALGKARLG